MNTEATSFLSHRIARTCRDTVLLAFLCHVHFGHLPGLNVVELEAVLAIGWLESEQISSINLPRLLHGWILGTIFFAAYQKHARLSHFPGFSKCSLRANAGTFRSNEQSCACSLSSHTRRLDAEINNTNWFWFRKCALLNIFYRGSAVWMITIITIPHTSRIVDAAAPCGRQSAWDSSVAPGRMGTPCSLKCHWLCFNNEGPPLHFTCSLTDASRSSRIWKLHFNFSLVAFVVRKCSNCSILFY